MADDQAAAAFQQQVQENWPRIQALAQQHPEWFRSANPRLGTGNQQDPLQQMNAYTHAARELGIQVPSLYVVGPNGQVHKSDSFAKLLGEGLAITGGTILGGHLLAGAGGPATASTGYAGPSVASEVAGVDAVAGGGGGILGTGVTGGRILQGAKNLSPILGNAAGAQQDQLNFDNQQQLSRDQLLQRAYETSLTEPGTRLKTSTNASMVANRTPVSHQWGGPGSGLRGETVKFSGGYANPNLISPDTKTLADDIVHQQLIEGLKHGSNIPGATRPKRPGVGGNILGGAALATGIVGGLRA